MKIHIVGSGAIGGMAGVHMVMNGEDVTFVDQWQEHVDAMREHGLIIDGITGRHVVPVRAITPDELDEPIELAFIAVKSQHTEEALRSIMPHLAENATVVSLQNGFNAELIGEIIGADRVIGTVPDYTAALVAPGHLEFTVGGPLYLGELNGSVTNRVQEVRRLLSMVTATELTTNIVGRIWTKQCYMSQIVMTAMLDESVSEVMQSVRNRLLGVAVVREAIMVADKSGVTLESDKYFQPDLIRQRSLEARQEQSDVLQSLIDHFDRKEAEETTQSDYEFVKKGSGMWWDIVYRRRPSETRWLTGALIDRGSELGIPMPLNQAMAERIYEIERGDRSLGWANLDELAEIARAEGEPLTLE